MKITLYNVISEDGFVATKNGKEDFIPDELWNSFIEICNQNDVLIWGKNTYEAFKKYDQALVEEFIALPIRKVILSRDKGYIPEPPFTSIYSLEEVPMLGEKVLISGSATLNDLFVNQKLINQIVVNVLPVTIGDGIPQFTIQPDVKLLTEKKYSNWTERTFELI